MRQWYEELFDNYAKTYDKECFTQGTVGECDFIEKEIGSDRSKRILDIGCGTGRHSVELAKRGYSVSGFDLSQSQLKRARDKASELSLNIGFQKRDAREPHFKEEFDLAIMLCEGGFSLMETDEMNFAILKNAADALKPQGKFIFTTLNALFPLFHSVKDYLASQANGGGAGYEKIAFDPMTFREKSTAELTDDDGNKKALECDERYYAPSEITWMLKSLGFKTIGVFGSKLGAYSREDRLTTEDFEMLVVAEK